MEHISIDDFGKVEIRVGKILTADLIEGSDKLLKLSVDFGEDAPRQVLSGIRAYVDLTEIIGKSYLFVTNLAPRMMMGLESQAMVVAVGGAGEPFALFAPTSSEVSPGAKVH